MLKSVSMVNLEDDLLEAAKKLEGPDSSVFGHAYGFPVKDIVDAMRDVKLQSQHDVEDAIEKYGHIIKHPPEDCLWFWFESPGWTWQNLCGRAGWMVISKSDLKFIHFFLELMN